MCRYVLLKREEPKEVGWGGETGPRLFLKVGRWETKVSKWGWAAWREHGRSEVEISERKDYI